MVERRRCIYCLEMKGAEFFNRGHVFPQAFGLFGKNMVLDCVCEECNQELGDTIELRFARDSLEGLDRFKSGDRPASEYKHSGKENSIRFRIETGPHQGAIAWHSAVPNGSFGLALVPQIGLAFGDDDAFTFWPAEELPDRDSFLSSGIERGTRLSPPAARDDARRRRRNTEGARFRC